MRVNAASSATCQVTVTSGPVALPGRASGTGVTRVQMITAVAAGSPEATAWANTRRSRSVRSGCASAGTAAARPAPRTPAPTTADPAAVETARKVLRGSGARARKVSVTCPSQGFRIADIQPEHPADRFFIEVSSRCDRRITARSSAVTGGAGTSPAPPVTADGSVPGRLCTALTVQALQPFKPFQALEPFHASHAAGLHAGQVLLELGAVLRLQSVESLVDQGLLLGRVVAAEGGQVLRHLLVVELGELGQLVIVEREQRGDRHQQVRPLGRHAPGLFLQHLLAVAVLVALGEPGEGLGLAGHLAELDRGGLVEDLVRAVVDAALVEHRTGLAELHDDALADLVGELTLGGQTLGGALAPLVHLVAVDQGRGGQLVHG